MNVNISNHLKEISYYYKLNHDNIRSKVFNDAALKIEDYPYEVISGQDMKNKLGKGIGPGIIEVVDEYISTGTSKRYEDLVKYISKERKESLDIFTSVYGIGHITANKLYDEGFRTLSDLWHNANLSNAQKLSIYYRDHLKLRIPRNEMDRVNIELQKVLSPLNLNLDNSELFIIAGSYRRQEIDSGDIDVLIKRKPGIELSTIVDLLKSNGLLIGDLSQGTSMYLGLFQLNKDKPVRRIDLLMISPEDWGSALMHFTGSKRFNTLIRQRAKELGYTLSQHGLYILDGRKVRTETEDDIFIRLGLKYIQPKDRIKNILTLIL